MDWLKPLQEKGRSGHNTLNFLSREGRVYFMDNHLAAAWCWCQELDATKKFDLFHIDRHPDWMAAQLDEWVAALPQNLAAMALDDYCNATYRCMGMDNLKVVRWDNYLPIFDALHGRQIRESTFCTHEDGDEPKPSFKCDIVKPWHLLENVEFWVKQSKRQWIMNIDIDFFFFDDANQDVIRWASTEYVTALARALKTLNNAGKLAVITFALSPECCGGWKPAEAVLSEITTVLGIDLRLDVG